MTATLPGQDIPPEPLTLIGFEPGKPGAERPRFRCLGRRPCWSVERAPIFQPRWQVASGSSERAWTIHPGSVWAHSGVELVLRRSRVRFHHFSASLQHEVGLLSVEGNGRQASTSRLLIWTRIIWTRTLHDVAELLRWGHRPAGGANDPSARPVLEGELWSARLGPALLLRGGTWRRSVQWGLRFRV